MRLGARCSAFHDESPHQYDSEPSWHGRYPRWESARCRVGHELDRERQKEYWREIYHGAWGCVARSIAIQAVWHHCLWEAAAIIQLDRIVPHGHLVGV